MNTNKKTKFILSMVGVSAILIPAILLVVFTSRAQKDVRPSTATREIDKKAIEEKVKNVPKQQLVFPSPTASTPSAKPPEGSSSAR